MSLVDICKENHVPYWLVRKNIKERGMSIEDAIKNGKPSRKHVVHYLNGVPLVQACRENNIRIETVLARVKRGETIEDAFNAVLKKSKTVSKAKRYYFAVGAIFDILKQDSLDKAKEIAKTTLKQIDELNDKA